MLSATWRQVLAVLRLCCSHNYARAARPPHSTDSEMSAVAILRTFLPAQHSRHTWDDSGVREGSFLFPLFLLFTYLYIHFMWAEDFFSSQHVLSNSGVHEGGIVVERFNVLCPGDE